MTVSVSFVHGRRFLNDRIAIVDESEELTKALQKTVQNAGSLLNVPHCSLALIDATGTTLITLASLQPGRSAQSRRYASVREGAAGWVIHHRKKLVINNRALDLRFPSLEGSADNSIACVPLMENDACIGILSASSPQIDIFHEKEESILTLLAEHAVLAISNARSVRIAYCQDRHLEMLLHLSHEIPSQHEPELLYRTILSYTRSIVACSQATLYLLQEGSSELAPIATWSGTARRNAGTRERYALEVKTSSLQCEKIHLSDERALPAWSARHRHPMLAIPRSNLDREAGRSGGAACAAQLTAPLIARGTLYGVLYLKREQPFAGEELHLMRNLCALAAIALESLELLRKVGSRATFLSMITHELRSPINVINGYLDLALEEVAGELNVPQREFLRRARAGSEHLYALLEDLLLLARADSGQLHLNRAIVRLQEIITDAVEDMELTAADNDISISVEIVPDFPPIYADAVRLQQVLRNLLSNALRFTPAGGIVTVCAKVERSAQHFLPSLEGDARAVKLEVRDTGIGIASEYHQRIFERFFQVSKGDNGRAGGLGLGLALVKMIVELHGGSVSVESMSGEGSTFTCMLPCLLT
jgi:signal transduction histidine kinase